MKTTLLFLSFFLSVSLFGQTLKVTDGFKPSKNSTKAYPSYEKNIIGKKKAVLEMYRVMKLNGIDSSKVELNGSSFSPIFHQENIKGRHRIWIFWVIEDWNPNDTLGNFKLELIELSSKESVHFGSFRLSDGTTRSFVVEPYE